MAGSRHFDDDTEVIRIGAPTELDNLFDGGGTVSAWCYPTSVPTTGRIATKLDSGDGWSFYYRNTSNSLSFFQYFSTDNYREDADASVNLDEWQYCTLVYDADSSSNRASFYINGVLEASTTGVTPSGTRTSDASEDFCIGNTTVVSASMRGDICYVQAWDRTLSAEEIVESMFKPGSVRENLVGFWPCLGDSPERDLSIYGNTGTVTGATTTDDGPPITGFI